MTPFLSDFRPARLAQYKPLWAVLLVLAAGLSGYHVSLPRVFLLAAVAVGGIALLILLKQPALGLLAVIPVALMGQFSLNSGSRVPITMIIILTGLLLAFWLFRMFALDREIHLPPSRVNRPALVFVLVTSLALLFGFVPWLPLASQTAPINAQLGGWALYVFSMGMLLLVAADIKQEHWLQRLTWLFLGLSSVYILLRAIPGTRVIRDMFFVPTTSLGSMFWVWLIVLAGGQALYNQDLRRSQRLGLWVLVGLTFYVGISKSSQWHSGWIPPLIGLAIIVWLRSWRWGTALIVLVLIFAFFQREAIAQEVRGVVEQYTVTSRIATWPVMIEIIKTNPVIGVGPGNYRYYTSLYPIWGYYINFNSHNNYLDIIAQTGFLGLAVFGWLVFEIARLALALRRRVRSGFAKGYVNGALGGLAAMLIVGVVGDWFLPFVYNVGFSGFRASILAWVFLGGLVALEQITSRQAGGATGALPSRLSEEQVGVR